MDKDNKLTTCGHCQKEFNNKMRYCPHCGAEHRKAAADNTTLACPHCACGLQEVSYRGSRIDICPQCHGLWLDTDEFAFHASERDTFNDSKIPRKFSKPPIPAPSHYIKCLRCGSIMARQNFRKISGVIIDICRDHGVWLDSGELQLIRSFIANGGLDISQDKMILANKDEISKVARETRDLKTFFKTINKFNAKRILLQGF